MSGTRQNPPAPHSAEVAELDVPAFFVSSFNLSATSNEVVLVGNELFPTWSGEGAAQPPVLRPRLVIRLSPQSAKDLSDVLQNFVANFERAYGELRTDYLLRKQIGTG
ncbi:MAG: hypothetical protein WA709_15350 [Stellaceae bacterium]